MDIAKTYAGEKVVNMMSVGASQQVIAGGTLSEMDRTAAKQIGFNTAFINNSGKFQGGIGNTAPTTTLLTNQNGVPTINSCRDIGLIRVTAIAKSIGGLNLFTALDALERKGVVHTLAEPTLVALSGETASFLAGGEFPVPVSQGSSTGGGGNSITVEFQAVSASAWPSRQRCWTTGNKSARGSGSEFDRPLSLDNRQRPDDPRPPDPAREHHPGNSVTASPFAIAGLMRNDFQDTVRQFPILGSLPIIGALFRSTGFQKSQTELVIIVTPHLFSRCVRRMCACRPIGLSRPARWTCSCKDETDTGVGINPLDPNALPPEAPKGKAPATPGKLSGPNGYEF